MPAKTLSFLHVVVLILIRYSTMLFAAIGPINIQIIACIKQKSSRKNLAGGFYVTEI